MHELIRTLYRIVGNKVYLRDLEKLFQRLEDMTPQEKQSLRFLARDLEQTQNNSNNKKQFWRMP